MQYFEHIELPAKLLDYFLQSNKSNINQSYECTAFHHGIVSSKVCAIDELISERSVLDIKGCFRGRYPVTQKI